MECGQENLVLKMLNNRKHDIMKNNANRTELIAHVVFLQCIPGKPKGEPQSGMKRKNKKLSSLCKIHNREHM